MKLYNRLLSPLKKGDKVGVWAASDPIFGTEATQWVARGRDTLEEMGFPVIYGESLTARTHYTAGTAELRWRDLSNFIQNKEIKLIITALGGQNANQILPLMDFELIAKHPKIIMGYSDPTVFLNPIVSFSKIPSFYGYHLASFDPKWPWFADYDRHCFEEILISAKNPFEIPASAPRECWREGVVTGSLLGGSLTDLTKLLGTAWEPIWDGAILILETMNLTPQKIDVYLTHLLQAKVFDQVVGLVLGKFHNCNISTLNLKKMILNILSDYKFPILKTQDFGHFSHMCPLPLGVKCQIHSTKKIFQIIDPIFESKI